MASLSNNLTIDPQMLNCQGKIVAKKKKMFIEYHLLIGCNA